MTALLLVLGAALIVLGAFLYSGVLRSPYKSLLPEMRAGRLVALAGAFLLIDGLALTFIGWPA